MRFCQPHWDKLRAAVDAKGLTPLVAEGGEQAAKNFVSALQTGDKITNFDPLMSAHWAIVSNATRMVGLALMNPNEDGSGRCPICLVKSEHDAHCPGGADCPDGNFESWIDRGAEEAADTYARLLKEAKPDA